MNETKELESRPADVTDVIELDPNDFKVEEEDNSSLEDTKQPTETEVSTPTETKAEGEVDFTPLLDRLSKDIKYMDEEVKIESLDDVKTNYQKGLNYGRLEEKLTALENSEEVTYIRTKAKEMGMTPAEYIKAVKEFEIQQAKEQEERELNDMIAGGVQEDIAKKVIETNRVAKDLAQEKLKLKEQQDEIDKKARKEAEDMEFVKAFPDVDIKTIPSEVFKEAEKSNLLTAYTKYQNQELKKQIELLKQNQENDKKAPIKGTTEHGGVVTEKEDDFLKGYNSVQ